MEISIVKAASGPHRAVVARPGAPAAQFAVYDYGPVLPHDLVHFVVEDELGLEFGFWGLVAAGANLHALAAFGARDRRRVPPPDDPLVSAHVTELLEAERLVGAFSQPDGGPTDLGLDDETTGRIRSRIDELNRSWQATPAGEVFRLRWPLRGPSTCR